MKPYNSITVAKYLLAKALEKGMILNVTKTQKLLFLVYGYYLASKGVSCMDEKPKAWPYGPVFPKTKDKVDLSVTYNVNEPLFDEIRADAALTTIINFVLEGFKSWSASELSAWSHKPGTPWYKTTKQHGFSWNDTISDDLIVSYFQSEEFSD